MGPRLRCGVRIHFLGFIFNLHWTFGESSQNFDALSQLGSAKKMVQSDSGESITTMDAGR